MQEYEQRSPAATRYIALLSLVIVAITFVANLGSARAYGTCEAPGQGQDTLWTVVIPDGFPGYIYIWRLKSDGTYAEDGRDAATGKPIQQTLSGRWTVEGARMILRQGTLGYVFDGVLRGDQYSGMLSLDTKAFSHFSAVKGDAAGSPPCKLPLVG
jgi:hypothetical protein